MKNVCSISVVALLVSGVAVKAQVGGGGTPGQIPLWTDPVTVGDSAIKQDANGLVSIGSPSGSALLAVGSGFSGGAILATCSAEDAVAVYAVSQSGTGIFGAGGLFYGVSGSGNLAGVRGSGDTGVVGISTGAGRNTGIRGEGGLGVEAIGEAVGVNASSQSGYGIFSSGGDVGIFGVNPTSGHGAYIGTLGLAVDAYGNVFVHGMVITGATVSQIDHPLDPANKYLSHASVQSPEMKNIYDGVANLDGTGAAVVQLPDYVQALNKDFRYQLTAVGAPGPNLYVSKEIAGNRFSIAGGLPGTKVSWQLTGTRNDAWSIGNPIQVESEKSPQERGYFLEPKAFNYSDARNLRWARYPQDVR